MRTFAILPLLVLAACEQPAPPAPAPDRDLCKASGYQGLVGQPETIVKTMMLPAGSRLIGPGDAVTMDFRPERLNIEIGTDRRIARIGCY